MPSSLTSNRPDGSLAALTRRLWRFLFAPVAALNLAVLRVVVFTTLLFGLLNEPIREIASWPRDNLQWPSIAGAVLQHLPIGVEITDWLLPVAIAATALALIGLFTRTASWIAVLLSVYLLGIAQYSGAANYALHHVVLIGTLLACSRAGDALSIDSLWRAFRNADRGRVQRVAHSVRYGLPIRLAMLVVAITYFFPGFWTAVSGAANLTAVLMMAVVWMIGWPLAVWWKPTRLVWAGLGLLFHATTRLLSRLHAPTLLAMYVMFVDWQRLFGLLGRKLFRQPITVLYDGNCKVCRRTMGMLLTLDWLEQLHPVNAFDRERFAAMGLGYLEDDALMRDMHAAERTPQREWHTTKGFDAYQRIAWRVPLLWPTLLVIYLPPVASLGRKIYRHVADNRACSVPIKRDEAPTAAIRWSAKPLLVVGAVILAAQVMVGASRMHRSWPVACYPLLDTTDISAADWPERDAILAEGAIVGWGDDALRNYFTDSRHESKVQGVRENQGEKQPG